MKTLLEWLRRKTDKKFLLSLSLGTKTPCSTKEQIWTIFFMIVKRTWQSRWEGCEKQNLECC